MIQWWFWVVDTTSYFPPVTCYEFFLFFFGSHSDLNLFLKDKKKKVSLG